MARRQAAGRLIRLYGTSLAPRCSFRPREGNQRALLHDLTLSVQGSHATVRNEAAERTGLQGMATTLTWSSSSGPGPTSSK